MTRTLAILLLAFTLSACTHDQTRQFAHDFLIGYAAYYTLPNPIPQPDTSFSCYQTTGAVALCH